MTEQDITDMVSDSSPCPVSHTDYRLDRPADEMITKLDEEREVAPVLWNDSTESGFLMVQRYADVKNLLGRPDEFVNDHQNAFDPDMAIPLLPSSLNPPEHTRFRSLLNPFFSPSAVKRLAPLAEQRAEALVEALVAKGRVDICSDFGIVYPTELFLAFLGLPIEDGAMVLPWEEAIFAGMFATTPEQLQAASEAVANFETYFAKLIDERMTTPGDPDTDIVSRLLIAELDGAPLSRQDVLHTLLNLMVAGLDSTRSAFGYLFRRLATNPELRHRLIAEPESWSNFIEETIRIHTLNIQDGRQVKEDSKVLGCPMKSGQMVSLGLAAANRDPRKFKDPDTFDMDREDLSHHLGFGAGIHRCLGMHFARSELIIALQVWHRRIPDYRLTPGVELIERGGLLALRSLPLEWDSNTTAADSGPGGPRR